MPRRRVSSERHGGSVSLVLLLAALNIAVAVVVNNLVSVLKDQVRRMHLLNTLGERLLLVSNLELVFGRIRTRRPLPPAHRGVASLEATSGDHAGLVLVVARAGAGRGPCIGRLGYLHVVAV